MARQPSRRWFGFRRPPQTPPPEPSRFEEAVDFFRARVSMPKQDWLKLGTEARQRGFTVADVSQLDLINQVWLALDDSIARGATFDEFKENVSESLRMEWRGSVENPPARIETIFRTNVMAANNAGRHAQMTNSVVADRRPYWQFVDIDDQRECPVCTKCHGTVLPMTDPWWQTHSPPLHFQCRCRTRPLTEKQAQAMGITVSPTQHSADEGFGTPPVASEPWRPDLGKYPPELAAIAAEKMNAE